MPRRSLAVQATLCARTWDSHCPLVHWPLVRTATSHKHPKCHAVPELQLNIAQVAHTRPGVAVSTHDKASTHGRLGPLTNITAPANQHCYYRCCGAWEKGPVHGAWEKGPVHGHRPAEETLQGTLNTVHTTTREREVHGGEKECALVTS